MTKHLKAVAYQYKATPIRIEERPDRFWALTYDGSLFSREDKTWGLEPRTNREPNFERHYFRGVAEAYEAIVEHGEGVWPCLKGTA